MLKKSCVVAAGSLALLAWQATAQDTTSPLSDQLPAGVAQIMQLEKAKVSDDTVIAYIKQTGNAYPLSAGQIVYLRQQGVSDAVLAAMLNSPKADPAADPAPAAPAPVVQPAVQPAAAAPAPATVVAATVQPVTYVASAPVAYYYPCYYPAYYRCPLVPRPVVAVGWGCHSGWHVGVAW